MKPELTQTELAALIDSGESIVVAFKSAFAVEYSHGMQGYYLRPLREKGATPYTGRGRFQAVTPDHFRKLQLA